MSLPWSCATCARLPERFVVPTDPIVGAPAPIHIPPHPHLRWPMLTGIMYVLVPMPYLFFGSAGGDGYAIYGSSIQSGWVGVQ